MTFHELLINVIIIILTLITIIFAIRYCKLLVKAQQEYEKAKDVIRGIILTFKRNQDKQKEIINLITFKLENSQSITEKLTNNFQEIENKFKKLLLMVESVPSMCKETLEHVNLIKKDVNNIAESQLILQKQFVILEEKVKKIGIDEKIVSVVNPNEPFLKLTETERIVIQFLINEGEKTAPEVEQKIGKTREHTARLMKKLWREGYIERDTHRIPYTYNISESIKKLEIKN